jgi:type VII secretion protein EccB
MGTRTEQVQAYRFVTRRIVSALLSGEPETTERPMRRFGMSVFGGVMIATVVFAAVGVYGFINPAGRALEDNSIVIERETGARYVFIKGALHPVLNYASARLVLRTSQPSTRTVSEKSLRGRTRGRPVGIPNAPDPLPARTALVNAPWSVCSSPRQPGSPDLASQVGVASAPSGGQRLDGTNALLVSRTGSREDLFVVWDGRMLAINAVSLSAIGLAAVRPVAVTDAFLNSLLPGPALAAPPIDNEGDTGRAIDGRPGRIGQVYLAAGQHYVLLDTGLSAIGRVMKDLLLAGGGSPTQISATAAVSARSQSTPSFDPAGFPAVIPEVLYPDREPAMVCSLHEPGAAADDVPTVEVHQRLPSTPDGVLPTDDRIGPDGTRLADRVVVPGGRAALVRIQPVPGDATPLTTTYLVTDRGIKYALPRVNAIEVQSWLGYEGVAPSPVPSFLLNLLPNGPVLDPVAAEKFVPDGTPTPVRPSPSRSP